MSENFDDIVKSLDTKLHHAQESYSEHSFEQIKDVFNTQFIGEMDNKNFSSNIGLVLLLNLYNNFKQERDFNTKLNIVADMVFVGVVTVLFHIKR